MITIFFSRKSAGKSTLAAQIASELAHDGQSVFIIDADPQGTISNWSLYRKSHEGLSPIPFTAKNLGRDLNFAIGEVKGKYDHVIVDLQGADSKENRVTLSFADKLIIPFKPTRPDLDNIPHIAEMLEGLKELKPGIEIHLVLNEAPNTSAKVSEAEQAREYFQDYGLEATATVIHSRKAYRDSMDTGRGVCELKDGKAKDEIKGLWSEIYKKGRLKPQKKTLTVAKPGKRKKA